jgi:two-component system CheB/CheR fusion protein
VYVIPSDKHMTVMDGHLRICPRPESHWSLQVNALFRSVAEHYRDKAVGGILSGL